MKEDTKEVGDLITVARKNWSAPVVIEGRIKEVRKSFGRNEYLITNLKVKDDLWIRRVEEEK